MSITGFHAKYLEHKLIKRNVSGRFARIAGALSDAYVDFNPHQIESDFIRPHPKASVTALTAIEERNTGYFESEFEKMDKWGKDMKHNLEKGLRQLDRDIYEARKRSTKVTNLKDKMEAQTEIIVLETRPNDFQSKECL